MFDRKQYYKEYYHKNKEKSNFFSFEEMIKIGNMIEEKRKSCYNLNQTLIKENNNIFLKVNDSDLKTIKYTEEQ